MTTSAANYPLTSAVSPRVDVVESTGSTNADLVAAIGADADAWPHLSLLLTTDQRAGRGRLDRTWTAPAGAALAVSVVVRVGGIPPESRGWIPLSAGAAMTTAVAEQLPSHAVGLKWPNDVLVGGRKICGILAEAVPAHPNVVVIGAGVNTRMTPAQLPVATATSFAAVEADADHDRLLATYVRVLADHLAALERAAGDAAAAGVLAGIEALCTTLGARVRVSLPGGDTLEGRAQRLDASGRLVVSANGVETPVSAGDVIHVRF